MQNNRKKQCKNNVNDQNVKKIHEIQKQKNQLMKIYVYSSTTASNKQIVI